MHGRSGGARTSLRPLAARPAAALI